MRHDLTVGYINLTNNKKTTYIKLVKPVPQMFGVACIQRDNVGIHIQDEEHKNIVFIPYSNIIYIWEESK